MPKSHRHSRGTGGDLHLKDNRPALIGFGLSLLQLLLHGMWLGLASWLAARNEADRLTPESPVAWAIIILMGLGTVATFAAIFVCLFYGLRRPPRTLAVTGFFLSFFCGVFATAVVALSLLRFAAGQH